MLLSQNHTPQGRDLTSLLHCSQYNGPLVLLVIMATHFQEERNFNIQFSTESCDILFFFFLFAKAILEISGLFFIQSSLTCKTQD